MLSTSSSSLKSCWANICKDRYDLGLPQSKWQFQWSCNNSSASRLYNAIKIFQPSIIIETGTFEAIGTFAIAKAAHENDNNASIYTIDYNGDPTTNLAQDKWKELSEIRTQNLKLIKTSFPNVNINFLEGDSRDVLSSLFSDNNSLREWDFFYQDSMHYLDGVLAEWNIMSPFASKGAIVVFDDLFLPDYKNLMVNKIKKIINNNFLKRRRVYNQYQFPELFFWQESFLGNYVCRSISDNHPQLWAQNL